MTYVSLIRRSLKSFCLRIYISLSVQKRMQTLRSSEPKLHVLWSNKKLEVGIEGDNICHSHLGQAKLIPIAICSSNTIKNEVIHTLPWGMIRERWIVSQKVTLISILNLFLGRAPYHNWNSLCWTFNACMVFKTGKLMDIFDSTKVQSC